MAAVCALKYSKRGECVAFGSAWEREELGGASKKWLLSCTGIGWTRKGKSIPGA